MVFIVPTAQFYLTNAGKAAALDATNNSINIQITHLAVGTAKYDGQVTAPTQTALTTEVGRYNLVGGGSSGQVLRLTTTLTPNYTAEIFEIGLFLSDGTLFAVAAVTGTDPLMQTANGLTSVITLGCSLAEVGSNVTVSVDANSPIAVVLMNQHIEHSDPHPQYVRHSDKASTTQAGIVQLDNQDFGELISSTNETKAVTPKQLGETNKQLGETNKGLARRIFFGQTSTDIVQSDNSNTFIRIFGGDGIVGGSTQIKGSGNVTVSTDSEGIGYLNIHGALNDSLTSTATNEALTARQGKVLKDLIDQLDVSGKYDKTGGVISGDVVVDLSLEVKGDATVNRLFLDDGATMRAEVASYGFFGANKRIEFTTSTNNYHFDKPIHAPSFFGGNVLTAENGYTSLPNGLILQWGVIDTTVIEGGANVTFPIAFPHACLNVTATRMASVAVSTDADGGALYVSSSPTTATFNLQGWHGDAKANLRGFTWMAIGY